MSKPQAAPVRCPLCHNTTAPGACAACSCRGLWSRKRVSRGMSPLGFFFFATVWALLAGSVMLAASSAALYPWTGGEPPGYTYALLGQRAPAGLAPSCRIEQLDATGRVSTVSTGTACHDVAPSPVGPTEGQRRAAGMLHSALVLWFGALLSWLLLKGLRPLFRRGRGKVWVRQAPA